MGHLFVVSAPAGAGKTTLVQRLVNEFPEIVPSVSYTTRPPRAAEIGGRHYHFVTEEEFQEKLAKGDFLEHVSLHGAQYGTSRQWIEQRRQENTHVVLVIDTQGAMQVRAMLPAILIFILPRSLDVLRERLLQRQTESPEMIEQRLAWATHELEAASQYDFQIINDDLEIAYQAFRSIFIAECHRVATGGRGR